MTNMFKSFKAILPVAITDSQLVSISIPEPDSTRPMGDGTTGEAPWSSGATYAKNARVIRTATHRVYRDAVGGVSSIAPNVDVTRWIDEGPTNRWAWADGRSNTKSVDTSPLTIAFTPGSISAIGLSGMEGVATVRVEVRDTTGGELVYDQYHSARDFGGHSPWWSWFFIKPMYVSKMLIDGLPPYPECEVRLTFTGYGPSVSVGSIMPGNWLSMGGVEYGISCKPRDYSYSVTDEWGNSIDRPGETTQDLSCSAAFYTGQANSVHRAITRLLGRPAFFVPDPQNKYAYLMTSGVIKSASIAPRDPKITSAQFDIEGRI
jgi:hypothetical protein